MTAVVRLSFLYVPVLFLILTGLYLGIRNNFNLGLVVGSPIARASMLEEGGAQSSSTALFGEVGGVIFDMSNGSLVPYLLYQTSGGKTATKALVFSPRSVCEGSSGTISCADLERSFAGALVRVEGEPVFEHVVVSRLSLEGEKSEGVFTGVAPFGETVGGGGISVRPLAISPAKPCSREKGCAESTARVTAEVTTASGGNRISSFVPGALYTAPGGSIALADLPSSGGSFAFVIVLNH